MSCSEGRRHPSVVSCFCTRTRQGVPRLRRHACHDLRIDFDTPTPARTRRGTLPSNTLAVASVATYPRASNGFSIADPDDAGMLDVVGFDTATPGLIADFAQ